MHPDKFTLSYAFFSRSPITIGKHTGIIQHIEHEDGSGNSFNMVMLTNNCYVKLYYNVARQHIVYIGS